jgi:hypothetical protein
MIIINNKKWLSAKNFHEKDAHDYFSSLNPTRKSLVNSKLSQLLAILGATFRRLGTIPLKKPRRPSSAKITLTASQTDVYR